MGLDDACNTGLVLGLGLETTPSNSKATNNQTPKKSPSAATSTFEPYLTLGLSGDQSYQVTAFASKRIDVSKVGVGGGGGGGYLQHHHDQESTAAGDFYRQASPHSAVSSFSSGRVKRERDLSSEEVDVEKNSSRVSDEDEDLVNARKKLRLSKEQSALLEESFKQHSTLNPVINPFQLIILFI